MTPEMRALARRAVACKGWRWMPGMVVVRWFDPGHEDSCSRVLYGRGFSYVSAYRVHLKTKNPAWYQGWTGQNQHSQFGPVGFEHCTPIPDLTDPATLGCLLALIRELLEDPTGYVSWYEGDAENAAGWSYVSETYGASDAMPTEAEALVVALEDIVTEEDDD